MNCRMIMNIKYEIFHKNLKESPFVGLFLLWKTDIIEVSKAKMAIKKGGMQYERIYCRIRKT